LIARFRAKNAAVEESRNRTRLPDHERGRIIMILYKPIVASVVTSLMIAGRRRPTSGASARCSRQRRMQYRHRPS
jgi:hypothetical protein